jgi:alpha-ribazole phosphatase
MSHKSHYLTTNAATTTACKFHIWRHPRPQHVQGRCIGHTDVAVDPRKSKRLAYRIGTWARLHGLPKVIVTSPLQRGADVGRWLARWGWVHHTDARLMELNFGAWDGKCWDSIQKTAIDAWCADFPHHAPGGGEAVAALLKRCAAFMTEHARASSITCAVGHAGWISAAQWLQKSSGAPEAATWPAAVRYGERVVVNKLESTKRSEQELFYAQTHAPSQLHK